MLKQRFQELIDEKNNGNQKDFALQADIPASTVNTWYNGKKEPKAYQLVKIADYFGVTTDYLLGREDEAGIVKVNSDLTELESSLVVNFRKLKARDQQLLFAVVQSWAS